jgi:hypothetical protein
LRFPIAVVVGAAAADATVVAEPRGRAAGIGMVRANDALVGVASRGRRDVGG